MTFISERIECVAKGPACTGRAEHGHHRKRRAHGGSDDPVNKVPVCFRCHRWIHDNPARSYSAALLLHSWEDETPL